MKLNDKQIKALKGVAEGADIYALDLAMTLRELHKKGLVSITRAQDAPKDGARRQPYFGCILNAKGGKALEENDPDNEAIEKMLNNADKCRTAIANRHNGQPARDIQDSTECPVCDAGTLDYCIAGSNGHISASCTGCGINFME